MRQSRDTRVSGARERRLRIASADRRQAPRGYPACATGGGGPRWREDGVSPSELPQRCAWRRSWTKALAPRRGPRLSARAPCGLQLFDGVHGGRVGAYIWLLTRSCARPVHVRVTDSGGLSGGLPVWHRRSEAGPRLEPRRSRLCSFGRHTHRRRAARHARRPRCEVRRSTAYPNPGPPTSGLGAGAP